MDLRIIRTERVRRGWSQTDLGARAKLSASEISRIETGHSIPYPMQLARLEKALGVRLRGTSDDSGEAA